MVQPGRDASAPWGGGDSPTSGSSGASNTPPQPIVLGGATGLSVNSQMQSQMPTQFTPAGGSTLSGQVGTIDSGVWAQQPGQQTQGSIIKGMFITVIFGFFILIIPMLLVGWGENQWNDETVEPLEIDWDEDRLNGTFQLATSPIEQCSLNAYEENNRWREEESDFYFSEDCSGSLVYYESLTRVNFTMSDNNTGVFTYHPSRDDKFGDIIDFSISYDDENYRTRTIELGQQTIDENLTNLVFETSTTSWNYCSVTVRISDGNEYSNLWPNFNRWTEPPNCSDMEYQEQNRVIIGNIDHQSGFGEIFLDEPVKENLSMEVYYYEEYSDGPRMGDFAPCFGFLFGLVLFIVWIVRVVQAFQTGLSKQGTGMLIVIIPAFFTSVFSVFFLSLLLYGF